jgi:predicted PurR-regulated permease PerM
MNPPNDGQPQTIETRALFWLLLGVSLALGWILLPFYGSIMWGAIIALMFTPLYRRLLPRLWGNGSATAIVTLLIVVVMVIIPLALVAATLARDAAVFYQRLQSGELNAARYFRGVFDALPGWATSVLDRFGLTDFDALQGRLTKALAEGSQFIATQALGIGMNTFDFMAGLFITLYLAFFMLRDGERLARTLRHAFPLESVHKKELIEKFTTVIRATVKGNLIIAAIQGALGGLAFWFLGVSGALFWAVLMAFLSLLPAVGAGLVWLPVAVYFLLSGAIWQSVALTLFGVLVIGLVDNVLRPALVGKDTRLPDYLVMITTLGGMAVFGINGFVLGPVIAALFIAVWHIYGTSQDDSIPH